MSYLVLKNTWRRKKPFLALKSVKRDLFGNIRQREKYIKKRSVMAVVGVKGSGKTRELRKIFRWSMDLYNADAVYIDVIEPIGDWYKRAGIENEEIKGLKRFEKDNKLVEVCKGKVILIDNIDHTTKTKLSIIKRLISSCKVVIVSCEDTKKIDSSIYTELRKKAKVKAGEDIYKIELEGGYVIKDISMILGIGLMVVLVVIYQQYWALGLIFTLRMFQKEGNKY